MESNKLERKVKVTMEIINNQVDKYDLLKRLQEEIQKEIQGIENRREIYKKIKK
jgi:hypothetical protein